MFTAIILMIIEHIRLKSLLKKCFIDNGGAYIEVFDYNGKLYDKNKYVQLKAEILSTLSNKQLKISVENQTQILGKTNYPEMVSAEIQAIELAMSRRQRFK